MGTVLTILETAAGFFVVLSVCFAWNVLQGCAHNCAGCTGEGACQKKEKKHELA
jgi:hypothetical protein